MNDSYFSRARRVIGAGLDTAIGAAERASGDSLMRQSIREVEDAIAELQRRQDAAHTRSARAAARHGAAIDRAAALGEQAAYALGAGRDDLARRAVAEQMMAEQAAVAADLEAREAISEAGHADVSIVELEARRDRLAEAFRTGQALSGAGGTSMPADLDQKVARAEAAFDRAAAAKDSSAGSGAVLAEIEAVRQEAELTRRLAELRDGVAASAPAKTKRRKPG